MVGMILLYSKIKRYDGFLTYNRLGRGSPLLFIHGYPLSRKIWQPQTVALSDVASIITVDLRGHGESYPYEPPYTLDMLAEDCKYLLDHIKITEPVVVCGLSMGGYVTLALYRKYPQIFRGMILTSTRAGADSPEGKAGREAAIRNVRENGVAFIADSMLPKLVSPGTPASNPKLMTTIRKIMLQTSVQGVIGASQGMRDRPDSKPLLAQIDIPVLIIHGANDQLIPLGEAENMHRQIKNSRLVVISQAGHLPNMEQPEKFNQAIRAFIQSRG
jgi:3-oxoadipate enol-lactonase